jgi:carboxylesterase type B
MSRILTASDGFRVPPDESEDCLFLNIWTPGLDTAGKRPVMVWLHGGGFSSGTSSSLLYDGTNLARRGNVVMVGVNHRLNVFGYTHFGDMGFPEYAHSGNTGQLDIIAALEWVRDNIDRFGGDPKRVMIFGESGGGAKVSMILASPPAYLYRFDWETPVSGGKLMSPHGLEMPMVFDNVERGGVGLTGGGDAAKRLAAGMSETWIAFAGTGNPNSKKSGLPRWEPYDPAKRAVMVFDNQSRVVYDPLRSQRLIFERKQARSE